MEKIKNKNKLGQVSDDTICFDTPQGAASAISSGDKMNVVVMPNLVGDEDRQRVAFFRAEFQGYQRETRQTLQDIQAILARFELEQNHENNRMCNVKVDPRNFPPNFDCLFIVEDFLDSLEYFGRFFDYMEIKEENKVVLVAYKFEGIALNLW
ncbi:uncharacterized protein LOC132300449 [Cornus florida]|uniref:uncharacterized protein LOC132300449 n=1 Tax=Cornus florida TaxID=4283 RepID=UPI00289F24BC|nr:uncharacterized protein LOC132300449 [Cornus florida]